MGLIDSIYVCMHNSHSTDILGYDYTEGHCVLNLVTVSLEHLYLHHVRPASNRVSMDSVES